MKNKRLFHGTTLDNYNRIIENNFQGKNNFSWHCSNDDNMYFYDLDKTDQDEKEFKIDECIRYAFESALLTACISNYSGNTLVVIEMKVPSEFCQDDYSCENMANRATQVEIQYLDLSMIKNIYISENAYLPSLRLLYCSNILKSNKHINTDNFTKLELTIAEKIEMPFGEELFYFDWFKEKKEFAKI